VSASTEVRPAHRSGEIAHPHRAIPEHLRHERRLYPRRQGRDRDLAQSIQGRRRDLAVFKHHALRARAALGRPWSERRRVVGPRRDRRDRTTGRSSAWAIAI